MAEAFEVTFKQLEQRREKRVVCIIIEIVFVVVFVVSLSFEFKCI